MRSALVLRRVTSSSMGTSVSRASSSSCLATPPPKRNSSGGASSKSPLTTASPSRHHQRRTSLSTFASSSSDSADAFALFAESQKKLPRPSLAEEARTILASANTAVLSTSDSKARGHPAGSVVQFALVETTTTGDGAPASPRCSPVLALSSMSSHTRDLSEDPRCSLTVLSPGFSGMEDSRVSLSCVATRLSALSADDGGSGGEEGEGAARAAFKARHPEAFWVDFGDFSWWRLDPVGVEEGGGSSSSPIPAARVVAGFGRAGSISSAELASASADPVSSFSGPVSGHMNADHGDAVLAVARSSVVGLGEMIERATMGKVDRLGFEVELVLSPTGGEREGAEGGGGGGERLTARIPFSRPAEDRKALKERLVEMTRAAASASTKSG